MKGSVEFLITLRDINRMKTLGKFSIMAKIDTRFNIIFGRPLLNELGCSIVFAIAFDEI